MPSLSSREKWGNGWNEYGWSIREALNDQRNVFDQNIVGTALTSVESIDSGTGFSFRQEIELNAQPGWRATDNNIIRFF